MGEWVLSMNGCFLNLQKNVLRSSANQGTSQCGGWGPIVIDLVQAPLNCNWFISCFLASCCSFSGLPCSAPLSWSNTAFSDVKCTMVSCCCMCERSCTHMSSQKLM
ncbi:hypothetical protein ILYODFUR_021256 [Ilyodon furcidens]|uniref:Uncharacterized protein n=1 Tax=Ilyodon furcidens TaxID=33524 RepID=A0ABV0UXT8_9TELE